MAHEIERVRHEMRFRTLEVAKVGAVTPRMLRVTLAGDQLEGFTSKGPSDHLKIFFPDANGDLVTPELTADGIKWPEGKQKPESRDYTPRRYDSHELDIDFVIHGDGPASSWASKAQPGDEVLVAGPRGSRIVPKDFDYYLLIGDETALPAISRHFEELPDATVIALVEVADAAEEQSYKATWLHRDGAEAGTTTLLLDALREVELPPGDGYVFAAGEANTLRAIRRHLFDERGAVKDWTVMTGYWKRGTANHDHHEPV